MRTALLVVACCCAGNPVVPEPEQPDASTVEDAGTWCAAESAPCLANGWEYEAPGHCCLGRMSCFKSAGASTGICAYTNWCADEGAACLAGGLERDVPGHCCNGRMGCTAAGCQY